MKKQLIFAALVFFLSIRSFAYAGTNLPAGAVFDSSTGMYVVLDSSNNITASYSFDGKNYSLISGTNKTGASSSGYDGPKDYRIACPLYMDHPTLEACRSQKKPPK